MAGQSHTECAETMRALRKHLRQAAEDRSLEGIALSRVDGTPSPNGPSGDGVVAFFERQVAERERGLGPEHPDTLRSRNNLGVPVSSREVSIGPCRCSSGTSPTASASWDRTIPTPSPA